MMAKIETNNSAPSAQVVLSREDCQMIDGQFARYQQVIDHLAEQVSMYKIGTGLLAAWSFAVTGDFLLSSACQSTIAMCRDCAAEGGLLSIPGAVVCGASTGFHYLGLPVTVAVPWAVTTVLLGLSIEAQIRARAVAAAAQKQKQDALEHPSVSSPEKKQI